jgi:type I restriction enzyme S subunit
MSLEKIIPNDWSLVNLSELSDVITKGTTPTTNGFSYLSQGVNFVKVESIHSNGNFISSRFAHVGLDCHDSFKRSQLKEGDILFTIAGALGRSAIVKQDILPANTNQAVAIIRLSNLGYKDYIFHYLRGDYVKKLIEKINVSTAQANLSLGQINQFKIPLPPLPEQQKIAEILSTVDAKIEVIDQQITETQALNKGLMQRLLTKGIGHTEFKDSQLGKIPKSWEVVKQSEVATFFNGRAYKLTEWEKEGIPVIRLQNLTGTGKTYYYSNLKLPDHQYCHNGDLLYMWSATFGPVKWFGDKAIYHYHIWKIEHDLNRLDSGFHYYLLDGVTARMKNESHGSTMLHVTKGGMEKLLIKLPSLKEQQKIADILSSVDEKLEILAEKKVNYQELKQGLMQQLLTGKIRVNV